MSEQAQNIRHLIETGNMPEESKRKALKALAIAELIEKQAQFVVSLCATELTDEDKLKIALSEEVFRQHIRMIVETPVSQRYNYSFEFKNAVDCSKCDHEFIPVTKNGTLNQKSAICHKCGYRP